MTTGKFTVADSRIQGQGLFASCEIAAGEVLGFLQVRPAERDGPHVLWCNDATLGYEVLCEFRYINHAVEANVAYYDDLSVVALRDIQPGEELTHYYGDGWEPDEVRLV